MKSMPIKDPDNVNWAVVAYLLVTTLLGSLASYAYRLINGDHFQLWSLLAQMLVSVFAGALIFFIASYFNLEFEIAGGLSGLAGWSGATLIKALEDRMVRKASGIPPRDDEL